MATNTRQEAQPVMVGESGPEMVLLPKGTLVLPNHHPLVQHALAMKGMGGMQHMQSGGYVNDVSGTQTDQTPSFFSNLGSIFGGGANPANPTDQQQRMLSLISILGKLGYGLDPTNPWARAGNQAAELTQSKLGGIARQQVMPPASHPLAAQPPIAAPPQPSQLSLGNPSGLSTSIAPPPPGNLTIAPPAPAGTVPPPSLPQDGSSPLSFTSAPTSSPNYGNFPLGLDKSLFPDVLASVDKERAQQLESLRFAAQLAQSQQNYELARQAGARAERETKISEAASQREGLAAPLRLQKLQQDINNSETPEQERAARLKYAEALGQYDNALHVAGQKDVAKFEAGLKADTIKQPSLPSVRAAVDARFQPELNRRLQLITPGVVIPGATMDQFSLGGVKPPSYEQSMAFLKSVIDSPEAPYAGHRGELNKLYQDMLREANTYSAQLSKGEGAYNYDPAREDAITAMMKVNPNMPRFAAENIYDAHAQKATK